MSRGTVISMDPPHLHLAATAFAYPVLDGSVTYSEAVSALMRAAVRERHIPGGSAGLVGLGDRLERTLNRVIAELMAERHQKAVEAICATVRPMIAKRRSRSDIELAARVANMLQGWALPEKGLDALLVQEVTAYLARRKRRA